MFSKEILALDQPFQPEKANITRFLRVPHVLQSCTMLIEVPRWDFKPRHPNLHEGWHGKKLFTGRPLVPVLRPRIRLLDLFLPLQT